MNTRLFQFCCLLGLLTAPIWTLAGCSKEVAHTEKVTEDSKGNQKKEETTVTRNPDGSIKTDTTKTENRQP